MDPFAAPAGHLFERHGQVDLDVLSSGRTIRAAPEKSVEKTAAKIEVQAAEEIFEVDAAEQVLGRKAGHSRESQVVILRPLLRVGENGIRLCDLFKAFFGTRLFVAVRMVLERELAEGSLDRLLVRVARDSENLVVIPLCRGSDAPPSYQASAVPACFGEGCWS